MDIGEENIERGNSSPVLISDIACRSSSGSPVVGSPQQLHLLQYSRQQLGAVTDDSHAVSSQSTTSQHPARMSSPSSSIGAHKMTILKRPDTLERERQLGMEANESKSKQREKDSSLASSFQVLKRPRDSVPSLPGLIRIPDASQSYQVFKDNVRERMVFPPVCTRNMTLIDADHVWHDEANQYLSDYSEFHVIGVLGKRGVGKSTIMSELAKNCACNEHPVFPSQSKILTSREGWTSGINIYIAGDKTRVIFLDVEPVLSSRLKHGEGAIVEGRGQPLNFDQNETVMTVEVASLRLTAFLLAVCHILLIVSDTSLDTEIYELIQLINGTTVFKPIVPQPGQPPPGQLPVVHPQKDDRAQEKHSVTKGTFVESNGNLVWVQDKPTKHRPTKLETHEQNESPTDSSEQDVTTTKNGNTVDESPLKDVYPALVYIQNMAPSKDYDLTSLIATHNSLEHMQRMLLTETNMQGYVMPSWLQAPESYPSLIENRKRMEEVRLLVDNEQKEFVWSSKLKHVNHFIFPRITGKDRNDVKISEEGEILDYKSDENGAYPDFESSAKDLCKQLLLMPRTCLSHQTFTEKVWSVHAANTWKEIVKLLKMPSEIRKALPLDAKDSEEFAEILKN